MGLLPSEILQLKIVDIELDFQVLRVGKEGQKRVLRIPDALLGELTDLMTGTYLFDNKGKPYSRQWGFRQLESFLMEKVLKIFQRNPYGTIYFKTKRTGDGSV